MSAHAFVTYPNPVTTELPISHAANMQQIGKGRLRG